MRCKDEEEQKELKNKIAKVNTFIYAKDQPFKAAEAIKHFESNYEKACTKLRKHAGNGKDIKDYTVVEYYTLLQVLEEEHRKQKNK